MDHDVKMSEAPAKRPKSAREQDDDGTTPQPGVDARDPMYFGYYALLTHQQNMLIDQARTTAYQTAMMHHSPAFRDALVMDVGAGSGILSYFAVQAGARHVYSVEASNVARRIRQLVADAERPGGRNAYLAGKITVVQSKVEQITQNIPKVDVLISEPIGVLLFHERMLESFLYARDTYLKPGGTILPSAGSIFLAPFTDAFLYTETMTKARFWDSPDFYGVDLSGLFTEARAEYFSLPVVGHFDPNSLVADPAAPTVMDFATMPVSDLYDVVMPFSWTAKYTGLVHGIAGWFDLAFGDALTLSTAPSAPNTHWQQIRFLFSEPLAVNAGDVLTGWLRGTVNAMRSYTLVAEVAVSGPPACAPRDAEVSEVLARLGDESHAWLARRDGRRRGRWLLHEQTYSYTYQPAVAGAAPFVPEHSCLYTPPGGSSTS
ncbi:hypothetical protein H9P43_003822 [Blastocladiella emersonii ATCC 22665]|nr:hypothetical protein H9P43_003822 [Blastocladiella emersonii ATCC 22665]